MYIFYEDFLSLAQKVFEKISLVGLTKNYKGIICPLNGGLYLSEYLSRRSSLPIYCIDIKSYNKEHKQDRMKIKSFVPVTEPGNYIIADDIYDTGNTLKQIIDFYSFKDRFKFDVAVLVTNKVIDRVNFYGVFNQTKEWVNFCWETT